MPELAGSIRAKQDEDEDEDDDDDGGGDDDDDYDDDDYEDGMFICSIGVGDFIDFINYVNPTRKPNRGIVDCSMFERSRSSENHWQS